MGGEGGEGGEGGDEGGDERDINQSGDAVRLELGYGRPFTPAHALGDETAPLPLPIEYGLQGGHHVDISLRFIGALDPDLVDLSITLELDPPLSGRYWGQHETEAWYLLFPQDSEPSGCYFHRARVFLFNESGEPLQISEVSELDHKLARLTLKLTAQRHVYQWKVRGSFRAAADDL